MPRAPRDSLNDFYGGPPALGRAPLARRARPVVSLDMPPVWFRLLVALSLWTSALAQGVPAPVISEFLASNSGGLRDEEGDSPDWMEIHNPGATSVNLGGWFLTDATNRLNRWWARRDEGNIRPADRHQPLIHRPTAAAGAIPRLRALAQEHWTGHDAKPRQGQAPLPLTGSRLTGSTPPIALSTS